MSVLLILFFLFKQKTAYEMRISDWSSDVCSSDLAAPSSSGGSSRCRSARVPPDRFPGAGWGCCGADRRGEGRSWVGHSGIRRSERIATGQDRHSRESGNDSIGVATDRSSQSLPAAPHPVQCGSADNIPALLAQDRTSLV